MEKAKGKKAGEQDKESAFNVRSLLGEKKTDPSEELNKKLLKAARDWLVTLQNRFIKNWRNTYLLLIKDYRVFMLNDVRLRNGNDIERPLPGFLRGW